MEVSLNGQRLDTPAASLHDLLTQQGFDLNQSIACAINQVFVPRPQWPHRPLHSGDRVDVIAPVTGG